LVSTQVPLQFVWPVGQHFTGVEPLWSASHVPLGVQLLLHEPQVVSAVGSLQTPLQLR
jgi:hypothetical protein